MIPTNSRLQKLIITSSQQAGALARPHTHTEHFSSVTTSTLLQSLQEYYQDRTRLVLYNLKKQTDQL